MNRWPLGGKADAEDLKSFVRKDVPVRPREGLQENISGFGPLPRRSSTTADRAPPFTKHATRTVETPKGCPADTRAEQLLSGRIGSQTAADTQRPAARPPWGKQRTEASMKLAL